MSISIKRNTTGLGYFYLSRNMFCEKAICLHSYFWFVFGSILSVHDRSLFWSPVFLGLQHMSVHSSSQPQSHSSPYSTIPLSQNGFPNSTKTKRTRLWGKENPLHLTFSGMYEILTYTTIGRMNYIVRPFIDKNFEHFLCLLLFVLVQTKWF